VQSFALRGAALQCGLVLRYPHRLALQTRWKDNDVYGHVNNAEYYSYFDSAINAWLIREGGLDVERGTIIGLCVESHCEFHAALAFPDALEVGLRVGKLGRSSVRYELAIFRAGQNEVTAEGHFVHVFVDREKRRPTPIPEPLRGALERLMVADEVPSP
jgi:acyl-CoA thioester hydrolase